MKVSKCKCCGKMFMQKDKRKVCCSVSCGKSYAAQKRRGVADRDIHPPMPSKMRRASEEAAFMSRARLAKRDLDFRDSPYAPPVTVEERGGRVIETRGQVCAGWRSDGHVSHNS